MLRGHQDLLGQLVRQDLQVLVVPRVLALLVQLVHLGQADLLVLKVLRGELVQVVPVAHPDQQVPAELQALLVLLVQAGLKGRVVLRAQQELQDHPALQGQLVVWVARVLVDLPGLQVALVLPVQAGLPVRLALLGHRVRLEVQGQADRRVHKGRVVSLEPPDQVAHPVQLVRE